MSKQFIETAYSPAAQPVLRRLSLKLVLLVVAKVAVLTLIWWVVSTAHPRPDTSPAAIKQRLAPAASPSPTADQPP